MNVKKKCSSLEEALETWEKIPFGMCKSKEGDKHNHLTIKYRTINQGHNTCVVCECDCGNYKKFLLNSVKSGHTQSCGCLYKKKDLTGQKFGRWTVLEDDGTRENNHIKWKCQCECGNIRYVDGSSLLRGETQSCGCLLKEKIIKNLVGQKFGKLTVLEDDGTRGITCVKWKCQCECGNICYVVSNNLISRHTQSCGCYRQTKTISKGELKITQILKENNIFFTKEKSFNNCRFKDTNALARFDFYADNKYLIEYDGEQHFYYNNSGWNTKENYLKVKEHDEYKNQYCKENNIPLIRIPYTHYDNLCLEDLILETTKWRVI